MTTTKTKWIDLMFEIEEGECVFVELKTEEKTRRELIDEAKQVLKDNGCKTRRFLGFYTEEEAEMMGLDTY